METNATNYYQPEFMVRRKPSLWEATKTCLIKKYAVFSGRARRSEYWWFMLAQYLLSTILGFVAVSCVIIQVIILGITESEEVINNFNPIDLYLKNPGMWLYALVSIALIIPNLSAAARRLHDIGLSGWYLMLPMVISPLMIAGTVILTIYNNSLWYSIPVAYLISLAIMIIFLVWLCTDSKKESNEWGPSPKYFKPDQETFPQR